VRLTWEPVRGAERYRLDRAPAGRPGDFTMISDTITGPRYDDRSVNRSVGYYYRVASVAGDRMSRFTDSIRVYLDLASFGATRRPVAQLIDLSAVSASPRGSSLRGRYVSVSNP
jgi:hypothetical protein